MLRIQHLSPNTNPHPTRWTENHSNTMKIIHTFLFVFLLFWGGQIHAQALINQLPISGKWALIGDLFVDEDGNYIYVQEVNSGEGSSYPIYTDLILQVGEQLLDRASGIEAGSPIPCKDRFVYDYYILKISPEFELLDYQVISQVTGMWDTAYEGGKVGMVFNSCGDAPMHVGDEVIPSSLDTNGGRWALILDSNLDVEWAASLPRNSVSQICPAGPGDSSVYLGVYFDEADREVIVLGDTLRNYGYERQFNDSITYYSYFHSGLFFKYNYKKDSVLWTSRIASDWSYTKVLDIQLNKDDDPIFLAQAGGEQTSIGDNFEDTVEIFGYREPSLLWDCVLFCVNDQNGGVKWATSTPEARYDVPLSFKQDSEGSIYARVSLRYGDTLRLRDTLLKQPRGIGTRGNKKYGVVKFDSVGAFQWIHQIEGGYDRNVIYKMRLDEEHNLLNLTTYFQGGFGYFGDTIIETIAESDRSHSARINYGISTETGGVSDYYYSSYGNSGPRIFYVAKEAEGRWMGVLETSFLQEPFFGEDFPFTGVLFFQADPNAIVSAIEQTKETPVTLYPNPAPAGDRIQLDGLKGIQDIQAIHLSGQPAPIRWSAHAHGAELYFSDALPSGLYLLQVETETGIHYAKVQIQ